jgi:transposase
LAENEDKKLAEDAEKLKKQLQRLQACPYCQALVELIWVHGHYQCPNCKNVVVSCCGES